MSIVVTPPIPPLFEEGIAGIPLVPGELPEHITIVRLHAFGDAVITLPVIAGLRDAMPDSKIEMVTSTAFRDLFVATGLLDQVHGLPMEQSRSSRGVSLLRLLRSMSRPDLFLDLQRSRLSTLLRRMLRPAAWVAFDRFAPHSALDRSLDAVRWTGLPAIEPMFDIGVTASEGAGALDRFIPTTVGPEVGPLVCLNPAGCWSTKNWPPERYVELGRMMIERWNARIVLLGTENVRPGGMAIAQALGSAAIDLIGRTTPVEALALMREIELMVTDDSGLMHLAWVAGTPTVGIFGASRRVWSRPVGPHTLLFGSEDLPCGACMRPSCARGDIFCLTRLGVEQVMAAGETLLRAGRWKKTEIGA